MKHEMEHRLELRKLLADDKDGRDDALEVLEPRTAARGLCDAVSDIGTREQHSSLVFLPLLEYSFDKG